MGVRNELEKGQVRSGQVTLSPVPYSRPRYPNLEVLAHSRVCVLPESESEVVADTFIALSA